MNEHVDALIKGLMAGTLTVVGGGFFFGNLWYVGVVVIFTALYVGISRKDNK